MNDCITYVQAFYIIEIYKEQKNAKPMNQDGACEWREMIVLECHPTGLVFYIA